MINKFNINTSISWLYVVGFYTKKKICIDETIVHSVFLFYVLGIHLISKL